MQRILGTLLIVLLSACQAPFADSRVAFAPAQPNIGFDDFAQREASRTAPGVVGTGSEPGIFYDSGEDGLPDKRSSDGDFSRPVGFSHFGQAKFQDTNNDGLPDTALSLKVSERPAPKPRLRVYSAGYTVQVADRKVAIAAFTAKVTALGGYISMRQDAQVTARVPAAKFSELTQTLPKLGRILSESMKADDVTDRHTDLRIRMENAERSRKRLLDLLEKAKDMEDILKIETNLRRLTAEIERMKGQLKLLNDKIAFATVRAEFRMNAPKAKPARKAQRSHFFWIRSLGVDEDLRSHQP